MQTRRKKKKGKGIRKTKKNVTWKKNIKRDIYLPNVHYDRNPCDFETALALDKCRLEFKNLLNERMSHETTNIILGIKDYSPAGKKQWQCERKKKECMENLRKISWRGGGSAIKINSDFESGNIIVKSIQDKYARLEIKKDPYIKDKKQAKYQYWFYFKVKNIINKKYTFVIENLKIIPPPWNKDWNGLNIAYSYDNKNWKRCKTNFDRNKISWTIKPTKNIIWFAYYPPYTFSRTKKLFKNDKIIGYSNNKNPIYMKTIGNGPIIVWVIARQHPGETIGSWMMEGFLKRIKQFKKKISKKYTIKMIGNANPDGTILGYWYTNAKGENLNRDWLGKTKSKEIKCIKKEFEKTNRCDILLDFHGDEGSLKHFLVASYNNTHLLHNTFNKYLNSKNNNFRKDNFYPAFYMKTALGAADDFSKGITVEAAMKHKISGKTLQNEPLEIGKHLADVLINLQK